MACPQANVVHQNQVISQSFFQENEMMEHEIIGRIYFNKEKSNRRRR